MVATVSPTESSPGAKGDGLFGPVRRRLSVDDYYRMAEADILDRGGRTSFAVRRPCHRGASATQTGKLLEAGESLPLNALRLAAGGQPAVSLMQLLPVRP